MNWLDDPSPLSDEEIKFKIAYFDNRLIKVRTEIAKLNKDIRIYEDRKGKFVTELASRQPKPEPVPEEPDFSSFI